MNKQYTILAIMEGRGTGFFESEQLSMAKQADMAGQEQPESDLLSMVDNVAVIEVKGQLTNKDSWYNRYYDLISYNQIREAAIEALDFGAGAILFDIDSPGGTVSGMKDLSNFISTLDVPTLSHTSGTMSSAAYFTGISCDNCYMDDMAEAGSVGVVMTLMEYTESMKKQGVTAEVFRSGKHKQAGNPYEKLTADNRKYIQDQVMTYAEKFYNFVSEKRGLPRPVMTEIETGKTFIGEEAVAAGLVDKIMSFDEALAKAVILAEKTLDGTGKNSNLNPGYRTNISALAQGEQEMAKKAISKDHLTALVNAGKKTPATDASDEQKPELTAEEIAAEAALKAGAEGSDTDDQAGDDPAMVEASELVAMTEQFDTSQVELAESATKLTAAEEALTALEASHKEAVAPMIEVICSQITTMRVALSLSSVDMTEWKPDAIMAEYDAVSKTFEKSLPVGGVVPEETDDKKEVPATRADANAIKNLW